MSARVLRKRPRTDDAEDAEDDTPSGKLELELEGVLQAASPAPLDYPEQALKQDEEFWYSDGTVILVARDVQFRVYQGILADHSPVLKDLFAALHPTRQVSMTSTQPAISCPVVRLSDSPEDLRHVLRAYMPRGDAILYAAKEPSFHVISASIRLGLKYKITPLYEQSLRYLKSHFTTTLDGWNSSTSWAPPTWNDAEVIGVVNLARLTGELSMLPTALLGCMSLDDNVVRGFTREDGSQENLTLDDLGICFKANMAVRQASVAVNLRALKWVSCPSECKSPKFCKAARRSASDNLDAHMADLFQCDPFTKYEQFVHDGKLAVCGACLSTIRDRNDNELLSMWGSLPALLGVEVPGWGQPEDPPQGEVPVDAAQPQ